MIEEKISSDGANEIFISALDPQALEYKAMVLAVWPNTNVRGLQMLIYDKKKQKINLTFDTYPDEEVKKEFAVQSNHMFCDYYAIECLLDKRLKVLKIYDQNLQQHPLPSLPPGSRIDNLKSGVGVYYGEGVRHLRKVYFLHNNIEWVRKWFADLSMPLIEPKYEYTIFGLEYNIDTLKATHISQYNIEDKDNLYSKDSLKQ